MPNIKLNYLYCDYANYKNYYEAVFANPENLSLQQINEDIVPNLLDGIWFYAGRWGLKDLHFEKYDDENDHPYHELINVEFTDEVVTEAISIKQFIKKIKEAGCTAWIQAFP